ncbi:MAG: hypothetical protein HOF34_07810 [Rhodospirillaceae bacterium]|nr:hypothetical protein [Rhodospirillaceae bacterium]
MRDETDQPASKIVDAFGGIRPMAARLDVPVSTVQGWKQRDTIPAARMEAIRAAAAAEGIDLSSGSTGAAGPSESNSSKEQDETREERDVSPGSGKPEPRDRATSPARGGGLAILALAVAIGVGGWVWWSTMGPGASDGDNARFSALEGRVARLAETNGDGAPAADPAALASLTQEVAALRIQLSKLSPPDMETALAPLRAEIDGLRDALAAGGGNGTSSDPAILARLDVLDVEIQNAIQIASTNIQAMSGGILEFDAKLKALTAAQAALESQIAALGAGRDADDAAMSRASVLALAAGQLRTALERGAPCAGPLNTAGSLGDADPTLNTAFEMLRVSAETGVATAPALELSFANLIPELLAAGRRGETGDLVDRLTGRINDIVRIRRTGADVQGNDIEARIARAEILLADRNVANVMSELKDVGGTPGEILSPWMTRAQAHLDAQDALAVIEAQAIARLRAEGGS